jgi:hypothetical protein
MKTPGFTARRYELAAALFLLLAAILSAVPDKNIDANKKDRVKIQETMQTVVESAADRVEK